MMTQAVKRSESVVASLPFVPAGYTQAWQQDRTATARLHSGNVTPGFSPKR